MRPSLRETLADSHVSAVAIAVLILWSLIYAFQALWTPLPRIVTYIATAIAIHGIPSSARTLSFSDRSLITTTSFYVYDALISLAEAWLLSRWIYGAGPLRSLSRYRAILARGSHA